MNPFEIIYKAEANSGKDAMVFDWDKAAKLIKMRGAYTAHAGLRGDWGYTGGIILEHGKIIPQEDTYTYLASTWAVPELIIDDGEPIACYTMQSVHPEWDAESYWPDTARDILRGCSSKA